jgi:hypothetical protein
MEHTLPLNNQIYLQDVVDLQVYIISQVQNQVFFHQLINLTQVLLLIISLIITFLIQIIHLFLMVIKYFMFILIFINFDPYF